MTSSPSDSSRSRSTQPALPLIAPSMLKCDFGDLSREIGLLEQGQAQCLHLDVMDGHFVPNLTYGPAVVDGFRKHTDLLLDAHLMIEDPARWIDDYIQAGCDWLTIHIEACPDPLPVFDRIHAAGRKAGIALNPETPVEAIQKCVGACDMVLVMSVHPGFGGQKFIPEALDKVKEVRQRFGSTTLISIDGGIGPATIGPASAAGVDVFVTGSSIFEQPCYATAIHNLKQLAQDARTGPVSS